MQNEILGIKDTSNQSKKELPSTIDFRTLVKSFGKSRGNPKVQYEFLKTECNPRDLIQLEVDIFAVFWPHVLKTNEEYKHTPHDDILLYFIENLDNDKLYQISQIEKDMTKYFGEENIQLAFNAYEGTRGQENGQEKAAQHKGDITNFSIKFAFELFSALHKGRKSHEKATT